MHVNVVDSVSLLRIRSKTAMYDIYNAKWKIYIEVNRVVRIVEDDVPTFLIWLWEINIIIWKTSKKHHVNCSSKTVNVVFVQIVWIFLFLVVFLRTHKRSSTFKRLQVHKLIFVLLKLFLILLDFGGKSKISNFNLDWFIKSPVSFSFLDFFLPLLNIILRTNLWNIWKMNKDILRFQIFME